MKISAIHILNGDQRKATTINFESQTLVFEGKSYLYASLRFEVGGNNNSLLFIHLGESELLYVTLDRSVKKQLLQLQMIKSQMQPLFKVSEKTFFLDLAYIGLFIAFLASLFFFRGPIAGTFATVIPVSLEKKLGDKIFNTKKSDELKSQIVAEQKLQVLLKRIKSYDENIYTVHISSKKEMNAYATIGGHLFINRGLIDELEKPEDLLGVIGHEMIHAKKRHVIRSIFQGAGLFLLIQTLLGDVSGLAAVLADNGGALLQLSYSRELEKEADLLAVDAMLESQIDPMGLCSALKIIESDYLKSMKETAGGETVDKILNQSFLRSHPQTAQRCLDITNEIDRLHKISKYNKAEYINLKSEWADFKTAMGDL